MLNSNNTIVVWYPNHGLRVRSCQTTVYPPDQQRRDIIDPKKRTVGFNKWAEHIRLEVAAASATAESQLDEAKRILQIVPVKQ